MHDASSPTGSQIDAFLPDEMARRAEDVGVKKANLPAIRMFVLAVLAGAFIALGAVFATTVTAGASETLPFGLTKLLGGVAFSLGLILVVVAGAELFTGNNLVVMAVASGKVSVGKMLQGWLIVYFGNFVGSILTAAIVLMAKQYEQGSGSIGLNALNIANAKCELEFVEAFALGVLCNALVCLAIWLCLSARTVTDKVLAIIFPITAFVAAGFEHSVANMYFVPYGLMVKTNGTQEFWDSLATSPQQFDALTWGNFLLVNLLPVTLGNIVGGALMVGLVYWFIHRWGK